VSAVADRRTVSRVVSTSRGGNGGRPLPRRGDRHRQENLEERQRGFRQALEEAIVKVTGASRLAEDPRLASALADAGGYVAGFEYEDRLAKKKLMDEQGTRERTFERISIRLRSTASSPNSAPGRRARTDRGCWSS
jgi:hypothetical protein